MFDKIDYYKVLLFFMDLLNKKFGLRGLLKQGTLRTMTVAISEDALRSEKEPEIRTKLRLIAVEIAKNPGILFHDYSTSIERKASWYSLVNKDVNMNIDLDSRSRPGHLLIDYHMPHFWSVKNWKGVSVSDLAKDSSILYKALWANLRMHSTPYTSEIRRSLCMVGGLSNVTKYRAPLAKAIVQGFGARSVLDPCAGWGGRMLGALAAGATYTGCEPCTKTVNGLYSILSELPKDVAQRCTLIHAAAETGLLSLLYYDMVLTSPPYYNLEDYSDENSQSMKKYPTWERWLTEWLDPVIGACLMSLREGGTSCWSVKNFKTDREYYLADEVIEAHKRYGWKLVKVVSMTGSGRPGEGRIKDGYESRGSKEDTYCFQRI